MSPDYYKEAYKYELFMCKALDNYDPHSNQMLHMSNLQNLMRIENGDDSFKKYHGSFEKQMSTVKGYMLKAMTKYLSKKKITHEQRDVLTIQAQRIEYATNTDTLRSAIDIVLDVMASK